jgi:hypothetical protein
MLNVNQFYSAFGGVPQPDHHLVVDNKVICAMSQKVLICCLDPHQDPFTWLNFGIDAVVFETSDGNLSIMILFDSEIDETDAAIRVCAPFI